MGGVPVSGSSRPDAVADAVADAHARLLATIAGLGQAQVGAPSLLPGWTRAHVLTHLARNADSNTWMLDGARADEVREQYPGGVTTRSAAIDAGAARPVAEIVADVQRTCGRLEAAYRRMDDAAWWRDTGPTSGTMKAADGVFSRLREVEVHHADLDLGSGPAEWSAWFVAGETDRRVASLAERLPPGVAVRLSATDTGGSWAAGDAGREMPVSGPSCWVLAWLLGRPVPAGKLAAPDGLPELGGW
jgi:maleylpyruvate isomerase